MTHPDKIIIHKPLPLQDLLIKIQFKINKKQYRDRSVKIDQIIYNYKYRHNLVYLYKNKINSLSIRRKVN